MEGGEAADYTLGGYTSLLGGRSSVPEKKLSENPLSLPRERGGGTAAVA